MARLRVWRDSSAVVIGRTACALAILMSFGQPVRMKAQLFSKAEAPVAQRPIPVLQPPIASFDYPQHQTLTYSVDWRGCSTGFDKQTQEGRRKIASDLSFDYAHGKQTRNERNLVKGTATHAVTNIPACVTDLLSAMFYTQSQLMAPGQTVNFPLADAMRTVSVGMKVEGREEIKTPAGTFQTIKVQATAEEGVVKNRGSIWIWYTDDPRHLPVQMQARLFWGTITFHLQSVEFK